MNRPKMFANTVACQRGVVAMMIAGAFALAGCDQQRMAELQPGESTEADVRAKFGEPEAVWDGPDGQRIFEYNRQPEGKVNYHIRIGTDGRLVRIDQLLTPENFQRVVPGMRMEDVRKLLGRQARITPYVLKREVTYEWRYIQPPNQNMVFAVDFDDASYAVKRAASMVDPESAEARGAP